MLSHASLSSFQTHKFKVQEFFLLQTHFIYSIMKSKSDFDFLSLGDKYYALTKLFLSEQQNVSWGVVGEFCAFI